MSLPMRVGGNFYPNHISHDFQWSVDPRDKCPDEENMISANLVNCVRKVCMSWKTHR